MSQEKDKQELRKSAGTVGGLTFISRILGFIRDIVTATFLGDGMLADSFFVAFRIPNLLRRMFGEGALTTAFIPVFTDTLINKGKAKAKKVMNSTFTMLLIALVFLVVLGEYYAEPIIKVVAGGFEPRKIEFTVYLLRIMFPYILLISLVAFAAGVLNSMKHFAAPAFAPSLLNISMITSLVIAPYTPYNPAWCLAFGVMAGGVLQLLIQFPPLVQQQVVFAPTLKKPPSESTKIFTLMLPAILGAAAYQINLLINTRLASSLQEGSVTYLYYSNRLVQFPFGLVAVALGTVILPMMSRKAAAQDMDGLKEVLADGFKSMTFLIVPAMVGLILLRQPLIHIFFEHGDFSHYGMQMTAYALMFDALGLLAAGGLKIVLPVFYARKDMWTPFWVSMAAVAVNITLALFLMRPLIHGGLALAVSLAATFNFVCLMIIVRKRLGQLGLRKIRSSVIRVCGAALAMGIAVHLSSASIPWFEIESTLVKAILLMAVVGTGMLVYAGSCWYLKVDELRTYWQVVSRRGRN